MGGARRTASSEHPARRLALLALLALACIAAGAAGEARAAPGAVFALEPLQAGGDKTYFVIPARPGATVRRSVRVINTGTSTGTVLLYPADATTGRTTGAVYGSRDARRRGVGAWTRLGARRLRLAPRQSRVVPITVQVPRTARPGQHLGGVTAEAAELTRGATRSRGAGSFRVDVRSVTVIAVQVDLPGVSEEELAVTGARAGRAGAAQAVLLGMRNTGNRLLKGQGRLTVRDAAGKRVKDLRFPIDTFVPRTRIAHPLALPGRALPEGDYRATVTLRYGHGRRTRATLPLTVSHAQLEEAPATPGTHAGRAQEASPPILWLALGGLGMLVAGFGAAAAFFRRRSGAVAATGAG